MDVFYCYQYQIKSGVAVETKPVEGLVAAASDNSAPTQKDVKSETKDPVYDAEAVERQLLAAKKRVALRRQKEKELKELEEAEARRRVEQKEQV
jgi:uncharacterized Zn finger protein (UPF0148 family)